MVLKLYSWPYLAGGGSRIIVALTLAEKQVPFELVPVDLVAREHKTPEFIAMHPSPIIDHRTKANTGDKFYRCLHGEPKEVLRMTTEMHGSLNGELYLLP
ncbi:hypothetical protein K438DRAFT_1968753 [Mycena galopus ATCC 62051]|nr:hypothetical protein K438DRAFT_1968753 [Mycena galopus ATCC 62051]